MKDKKLFNLNMPNEIYDYLNTESKKNYTTMSQYIINLILEDKKKYSIYEEMKPPEWFDNFVDEGYDSKRKLGGGLSGFGHSTDIYEPIVKNNLKEDGI